jgi:hypothetical protein
MEDTGTTKRKEIGEPERNFTEWNLFIVHESTINDGKKSLAKIVIDERP